MSDMAKRVWAATYAAYFVAHSKPVTGRVQRAKHAHVAVVIADAAVAALAEQGRD